MRLMILEDELDILRGLQFIVREMALDISEIELARTGGEAIEKAPVFQPDILLCDIRLPDVDGLEVIERVRAICPLTRFIILSGYGEFEYARRAIGLGVSEYLLKPVRKPKLREALTRAIQSIQAGKAREAQERELRSELDTLRRAALRSLVREEAGVAAPVPPDGAQYCIACVLMRSDGAFVHDARFELRMKQALPPNVHLILAWCAGEAVHLALLCERADRIQALRGTLLGALPGGRERFAIGLSTPAAELHDLIALQREAENDTLVRYAGEESGKDYEFAETDGAALVRAVRSRDATRVGDELRVLLPSRPSRERLLALEYAVCAALADMASDSEDFSTEQAAVRKLLLTCSDDGALLRELRDLLCTRPTPPRGENDVLERVLSYIEEHYPEDIDLGTVAMQAHLHPNYFSSWFHQSAGIPFSRYLNQLRVEKAKGLLADPARRMYEIAFAVGYRDERYFFRVFKQETGMKPTEYQVRMKQR